MRRRNLLRAGVATGVASLLGGCSSLLGQRDSDTERTTEETSPSGTETEVKSPSNEVLEAPTTLHGITFGTVLHAVDDLGMDPDGNEPIDETLDEARDDDTLIAFPPGTYLATDEHRYESPTRRFGLVGLGQSRRDVQFVFPKGNEGAPNPDDYRFLSFQAGRDVVVENLTFQMTDDRVTGVETVFTLDDGFWMVDVEFAGFMPKEELGPTNNVIAHITSQDGVGVIRRFVNTGGGVVDTYPSRGTPIGVFWGHRGEMRLEDLHIEESGSHSIYASRTRGCVRVDGGLFRNNDNTNLRISGGGHPSKRSWIKGARVEIDVDEAKHLPKGEQYQGIRGIWVEAGGSHGPGHSNLLIEDVDAVVRSNGNASDLPLLLVDHSHGSVTVRNSRFRSFVESVEPVDVRSPDTELVDGPTEVVIENAVVETDASRIIDEHAAISVTGRPNSKLVGSRIKLVDGWVDGVRIDQGDRFSVRDTQITSRSGGMSYGPDPEGRSAFGWNNGIVIYDSRDCTLQQMLIDVPGPATKFVDSEVKTRKISVPKHTN